ncbi:adenosine deaminase family protein [Novosphingobium aerophilum]|uniref:adenosine deaminase family protein n=1 Tax=Novosphingobium TaxID=165696 RepID=UPI002D795D6F|nr:adenosine deaminase [Novosphingobium sp. RL4]WRT93905.1 adenosine deaminase [Novosphingobium sp. RL4]
MKPAPRRALARGLAAAAVLAAALASASVAHADAAGEAKASALFDELSGNAAMLRLFLQAMPKGGDLHNHLGGTPSAEDWLDWAGKAGFCAGSDLKLLPPPCADADRITRIAAERPFDYARLVDHLGTRGWQKGIGRDEVSGHTQFFISFERFGPVAPGHTVPAMEVALRTSAGDSATYLELMHNPDAMMAYILAAPDVPLDETGLEARYAQELAGLAPAIAKARAELDRDEKQVRADMGCGTSSAEAACGLAVHYLASAFRALPPAQVFRSLIASFALADADPRYVGVNIVQPEDWPVSMRDYDLHMAMFRFLEGKYPRVHRTMHAGELAFGLVPPAGIRNHMRKALDAGAERIGHGVAIAYEDDAAGTLRRMARDHVAVEINLSSNDVILGVRGGEHPIQLYRRFGVPVTLSTDDQGILRTDLTQEYMRAAREQGLHYADLKQVTRASLEFAFVPGESLWRGRVPGEPVAACTAGFDAAPCRALLARSEKARLQVTLEQRLDAFEQGLERLMPAPGGKG